MQNISMGILLALTFMSSAIANHTSHVKGPDGQWLAVFSLIAGASGCPVYVEIPATFSNSTLNGTSTDTSKTIHGVIDDHGKITGYIRTPEGYPQFKARFYGGIFFGTWTAIGYCDGMVTITRVGK